MTNQQIESMTLEELHSLNSRIVEEIRYKNSLRQMTAKRNLEVGMEVKINHDKVRHLTGIVTKINPKKVVVKFNNGMTYNVAPSLIEPIK
jgi:phosphomannomutase